MFMTKPKFISSYNYWVILVWSHGPQLTSFGFSPTGQFTKPYPVAKSSFLTFFKELVGIPEGWRRRQALLTLSDSNVFRYSGFAILSIRGFGLVEGREHFTRHRERIVVTAEGVQLHTREETDIPGELL
jgi:hypothetical protein